MFALPAAALMPSQRERRPALRCLLARRPPARPRARPLRSPPPAAACLPTARRRYDWFASHSLHWPSLACRWGPVLEAGGAKGRTRQRLYLSEQTDGSEPNRIVLVDVDVLHPRTAAADHLQGFSGALRRR